MKITFVQHSCYTIETENYFLVFDYICGDLKIPENKKAVFFVSHGHADHYSNEIFNYNAYAYIISDDVKIPGNNKTIIVKPYNIYTLNDMTIKTTGSTDEGVAFYVNVDNIGIIHSGDLSHWVWDRYTKQEQLNMKEWFEREVDYFKDEKTDIVMMVVDPRMKDKYYLTAEYFLEKINAKYYFPLHMWNNFNISQKLKDKLQDKFKYKKIMVVHHDNEEFTIE